MKIETLEELKAWREKLVKKLEKAKAEDDIALEICIEEDLEAIYSAEIN